jgi:hypothetical protein
VILAAIAATIRDLDEPCSRSGHTVDTNGRASPAAGYDVNPARTVEHDSTMAG